MKKTLLAVLGFILLTMPLAATAQQFGDFTYTSSGSAITITGYTGGPGAVTIPDTIAGLPVTLIGYAAFQANDNLHEVTIPSSVTTIGQSAFAVCDNLTRVTITQGVTNIGVGAFQSCNSLTGIAIPESVTIIRLLAFASCASLAAITVDAANPAFRSLDGVLLNKDLTMLLQCPGGKFGSYQIPGSVTSIGSDAFEACTGLTTITIPGSVTNIGDSAFMSCGSLTNISIPDSITRIGRSTFLDCGSLTSVTISGSVTNIGTWAFSYCSSLKGVFFRGNRPGIAPPVFERTTNTNYYLPGATGWGATFDTRPTVLWDPLMQASGPSFGVGPAGFGFNITGTTNIPIVVEATTNLVNATWVALQSLDLTNGTFYFNDPNWTNYPARIYRIRSP